MLPFSLLSALVVALLLASSYACRNRPRKKVSIKLADGTIARYKCQTVGQQRHLCRETDVSRMKPVKRVCKKECLRRCRKTLVPTAAPTGGTVTEGPTVAPTRTTFSERPPAPFIIPETSSERILLPDPPVPPNLNGVDRNGCPHEEPGLKDWFDSTIWPGGIVPRMDESVTLPENSKVVIRQTIPHSLSIITIPSSSELVIGEDVSGIEIKVHGINVLGNMTIGSETCRVNTPITITLHGTRPPDVTRNPRPPVYKGISVDGGVLNLHGKRHYQTWARLAATVEPGDQFLVLQRPVNWEAGQEIVLVTSSMMDHRVWHQNEVLTIAGIHPDPQSKGAGAVVYLTQPVQHRHLANQYYQVEVGLLTRTVKIQGDKADSEPTDPDPLNCKTNEAWWNFYYNLSQPCTTTEVTGFGGHIMVHNGGRGYVEGVELFRMGQTNVMGRYPMHFHLLGDCPECYFTDSSVHESYFRCISIHGTNQATVSENVAYDITGYCYYLEDGVEEFNNLSFNLAAHIHTLGPDVPTGNFGQSTAVYDESEDLIIPADVTASGYYITNLKNFIVGNAASGGWSGFAFPSLPEPLGPFRHLKYRPSNVDGLSLDGNTAHSTGFWWVHAGAFYFGGSLYYQDNGKLQYNPGRSFNFQRDDRRPCQVNQCAEPYNDCAYGCPESKESWLRMTNSKAFLVAGVGINSWSGRMEVIGYESHDVRLSIESLSSGFWIDSMTAVCRTGNSLGLPSHAYANRLEGSGFYWYDTGQSHIITNAKFVNCGYRSEKFNQYDTSPTRGCGDDPETGCTDYSTVFGFLTHSDEFTPEVMQGTKNIEFSDCGRRFRFTKDLDDTVSGRGQNWLDVDGTVSGLGEATLIASGLPSTDFWWGVDDEVVLDEQAPLRFIKKNNGPDRSVGHFRLFWDQSLHEQVGVTQCSNGGNPPKPCPAVGYVRHIGPMFHPSTNGQANNGLAVTARADVVGPVGGFGWNLQLTQGAPVLLKIEQVEMDPDSTLFLSIAYPPGTGVAITAKQKWCWESSQYTCDGPFQEVPALEDVRSSREGNVFHMSADGVLTIRVFQQARQFSGNPDWVFPTYDTPGRNPSDTPFAVPKFERGGVLLPQFSQGTWLEVRANCDSSDGVYCNESVVDYNPNVCRTSDFEQVAYDKCCSRIDPSNCFFASD